MKYRAISSGVMTALRRVQYTPRKLASPRRRSSPGLLQSKFRIYRKKRLDDRQTKNGVTVRRGERNKYFVSRVPRFDLGVRHGASIGVGFRRETATVSCGQL